MNSLQNRFCLSRALALSNPTFLSDEIMARVSKIVGGRLYLNEVVQPTMSEPFITALVTTPIFYQTTLSSMKACVSRGNYEGARWLVAGVDNQPNPKSVVDVFLAGWYLADYDGIARTATTGAPGCFALSTGPRRNEVRGQHGTTTLRRSVRSQLRCQPNPRSALSMRASAEASCDGESASNSGLFGVAATWLQRVTTLGHRKQHGRAALPTVAALR